MSVVEDPCGCVVVIPTNDVTVYARGLSETLRDVQAEPREASGSAAAARHHRGA
jgi:hypothetical protein